MDVNLISNWVLIRLSGFLSYFLFTCSIGTGLMSRFSLFQKQKPLMIALHQSSGWAGLLAVIFHMTLLWSDRFVAYQLFEIFVPFSSNHAPIQSALGTDVLLFIFAGDRDFRFFDEKTWQEPMGKIHLLVIPAWILMVLHGVFIGTDSNEPWAAFLYGGGVFLVITLLGFRHLERSYKSLIPKNEVKKTPLG